MITNTNVVDRQVRFLRRTSVVEIDVANHPRMGEMQEGTRVYSAKHVCVGSLARPHPDQEHPDQESRKESRKVAVELRSGWTLKEFIEALSKHNSGLLKQPEVTFNFGEYSIEMAGSASIEESLKPWDIVEFELERANGKVAKGTRFFASRILSVDPPDGQLTMVKVHLDGPLVDPTGEEYNPPKKAKDTTPGSPENTKDATRGSPENAKDTAPGSERLFLRPHGNAHSYANTNTSTVIRLGNYDRPVKGLAELVRKTDCLTVSSASIRLNLHSTRQHLDRQQHRTHSDSVASQVSKISDSPNAYLHLFPGDLLEVTYGGELKGVYAVDCSRTFIGMASQVTSPRAIDNEQ